MKIKLNRALHLSYDKKIKKLRVGDSFLNVIEFNDVPVFCQEFLKELNSPQDLQGVFTKYERQALDISYDLKALIENLVKNRVLVEDWQQDQLDCLRLFFELSHIDNGSAIDSLAKAAVGVVG